MKKIKFIFSIAVAAVLLNGLSGCKKQTPVNKLPEKATTPDKDKFARMWTPGFQLYAVGHDLSGNACIYTLTDPAMGGMGGMIPSFYANVEVAGISVTNATGIACHMGSSMIISTSPASNFPNRLLIYPIAGPFTTPSSIVPCPQITDIEYNEYDAELYGIQNNNRIVRIDPATGSTTLNLAPSMPPGTQLVGLCNFNGLLTYCISNNNASVPDNFNSYNPSTLLLSPPYSYVTEWGIGNGGMQYCDAAGVPSAGSGWQIFTNIGDNNEVRKYVSAAIVPSPFFPIGAPGPFFITDLTSE